MSRLLDLWLISGHLMVRVLWPANLVRSNSFSLAKQPATLSSLLSRLITGAGERKFNLQLVDSYSSSLVASKS